MKRKTIKTRSGKFYCSFKCHCLRIKKDSFRCMLDNKEIETENGNLIARCGHDPR